MKGKERTLFYFAAYQLGVDPNDFIYSYVRCDNHLSLLDKRKLISYGMCILGLETRSDLKCRIMELGLEYLYRKRNSSIRRLGKALDRLGYHVLKCFKLK